MNIVTEKRIKPIAERMAKGTKPTDEEIQRLREATADVQDTKFLALLNATGNETTARDRRQTGKALLTAIRFATGARKKYDLPGSVRPEKAKRMLKQGRMPK